MIRRSLVAFWIAFVVAGIYAQTPIAPYPQSPIMSGPGGGGGGTACANPTGTIGLTAVNGVAATCIRSDGAPALSQAITPTWSGAHRFNAGIGLNQAADATASLAATQAALGVTSTDGFILQNTTAAAAGAQQYSPRFRWHGLGWQTTGPASEAVDFMAEVRPVQGTTHPTGTWALASSINGAAYADVFAVAYNSATGNVGVGIGVAPSTMALAVGTPAAPTGNVVAYFVNNGNGDTRVQIRGGGGGNYPWIDFTNQSAGTTYYSIKTDTSDGGFGFWNASGVKKLGITANGNTTLYPANDTTGLTVTGGSITGSGTTPFAPITGTWNTTGVVDGARRVAITETAKGANSLYDAIYGGASATTLEYSVATGGVLFVNSNINTSAAQTTYTGSISGTAQWAMPFQGASYKKFYIRLIALHDAGGTVTYPTAFSVTPTIYGDAAATAVCSTNTTTLTLAAAATLTGYCIVEGY